MKKILVLVALTIIILTIPSFAQSTKLGECSRAISVPTEISFDKAFDAVIITTCGSKESKRYVKIVVTEEKRLSEYFGSVTYYKVALGQKNTKSHRIYSVPHDFYFYGVELAVIQAVYQHIKNPNGTFQP